MFYGREYELGLLHAAAEKRKALVAIMGRRRIGKSELVAEFARRSYADESSLFLKYEGSWVAKSKTRDSNSRVSFQLEQFARQFKSHFGVSIQPANWTEAFVFLQRFLPAGRRVLLFFDEISWLADGDTGAFRASLKAFWDSVNSAPLDVVLVVAGSVTAWIRENILEDAGFHGRVSRTIVLRELPAEVCGRFLGPHLSPREKLAILMTIGGVPRYLEEMDPTRDSISNIQETFFSDGHLLNSDYAQIFEHTFDRRADTYLKIVEALIRKRPLSAAEIKRAIKYQSGLIDGYIKDLLNAGFLRRALTWRIQAPETRGSQYYQIGDNYLRFYLSYVRPNRLRIKQGVYRLTSLDALDNWDTISGLQFENLVANSEQLVLKALGLAPHTPLRMYGSYFQSGTKKRRGCQIDLLVETKRSLFVCETKFRRTIGCEVIEEVEDKIQALHSGQRLKDLNVFPALIYCGTLTKGLKASGYFSQLIDFEHLLG